MTNGKVALSCLDYGISIQLSPKRHLPLKRVMNIVIVRLYCAVPFYRLLIHVTAIGGFALTGRENQNHAAIYLVAAAAAVV